MTTMPEPGGGHPSISSDHDTISENRAERGGREASNSKISNLIRWECEERERERERGALSDHFARARDNAIMNGRVSRAFPSSERVSNSAHGA